jgi:hypothetical protein
MDGWESMFIQIHHQYGILIPEQPVTEANPLFEIAIPPTSCRQLHSSIHPANTETSPT